MKGKMKARRSMATEPENSSTSARAGDAEIGRSLITSVVVYCLLTALQMVVFFASAGHTEIPRAWFYSGLVLVHSLAGIVVLYKLNPELLSQRTKVRREGSKVWDEVLMRATNLTAMLVVPAVAALDIGRFHWSSLGIEFLAVGVVLAIVGAVLVNWAMVTNPYFEPTVRIQTDRGHRVITTGPYRFVRHPGYLSGIFWILSIPLIVGSLVAFVPAGVYVLLIMTRTWLEDKTLLEELAGYRNYAGRVRYRLFPRIW